MFESENDLLFLFPLDEAYKSNVRDKNRQSEMSQFERDRESRMVYQPKYSDKENIKTSAEKATFKSHMFSQKEREKKISTSMLPAPRDRLDENSISHDDFTAPAIPPTVAPPLLKTPSGCLTYNSRITWKLRVKKEVFRPNESVGSPEIVDLLFAQIVTDVYEKSLRISHQEKRLAFNFLSSHGVDIDNHRAKVRSLIKRQLIEMARSWPLYFSRLFNVNGTSPQHTDVNILAVHHTGVHLVRKENDALIVTRTILFEDLLNAVSVFKQILNDYVSKMDNRKGNYLMIQKTSRSHCPDRLPCN